MQDILERAFGRIFFLFLFTFSKAHICVHISSYIGLIFSSSHHLIYHAVCSMQHFSDKGLGKSWSDRPLPPSKVQQIPRPNLSPQHECALRFEPAIIRLFLVRLPKASFAIPLPSLSTSLPDMSAHGIDPIPPDPLCDNGMQQMGRDTKAPKRTQHAQRGDV